MILSTLRKKYEKKAVFSIWEVRKHTKYAYQLIHYLLKKKEIFRITKGYYTFHKDIMVVGEAYFPYYYGLYEALSLFHITEQQTNPILITPRKVRTGTRIFLDRNYVIKRIKRSMFFGFRTIKYYDFYIYISSPEKTLIDFIYFKQHIKENELNKLLEIIDMKKLSNYLKRCPTFVKKHIKSLTLF